MVRACQAGLQRAAQARRAPRERGDGGASPDLAYDVEEVVDVRLFMAWCHRPASRAQPLARACSGTGGASGRSAARLRRLGSSRRVGAVTSAVPKSVFSSTERETTHPRSRKSSERERGHTGGKNVDIQFPKGPGKKKKKRTNRKLPSDSPPIKSHQTNRSDAWEVIIIWAAALGLLGL